MDSKQHIVRPPVISPRYALKDNGSPDIDEILHKATNHRVVTQSPIRTRSNAPSPTPQITRINPPTRSQSPSPLRSSPHVQPTSPRTVNNPAPERSARSYSPTPVRNQAPRPIPRSGGIATQTRMVPNSPPISTGKSEFLRAQREMIRKAQSDDFDNVLVQEVVRPTTVRPQATYDETPSNRRFARDDERDYRNLDRVYTNSVLNNAVKRKIEMPLIEREVQEIINKQLGNREGAMVEVPLGYIAYKTSAGTFIVPDTERMTPLEREHERIILMDAFKKLKERWAEHGFKFDMPPPGEDLSTMHIRQQQYHKAIKKKNGSNLWWWMLVFIWGGTEYAACKWLGLKADGYLANQLKMYKIYEAQMIELGEGSGFGQDWPPWIQVLVTSAFSAAIMIFIASCGGDASGYSAEIMTHLNGILTGKEVVELDDDGQPLPPKEGIFDKINKLDLEGMSITKMMGMGKMFLGGFGGGGGAKTAAPKKKKTKEEIAKAKAEMRKKNASKDDD